MSSPRAAAAPAAPAGPEAMEVSRPPPLVELGKRHLEQSEVEVQREKARPPARRAPGFDPVSAESLVRRGFDDLNIIKGICSFHFMPLMLQDFLDWSTRDFPDGRLVPPTALYDNLRFAEQELGMDAFLSPEFDGQLEWENYVTSVGLSLARGVVPQQAPPRIPIPRLFGPNDFEFDDPDEDWMQ